MNIIKGIHQIAQLLSDEQVQQLTAGAELHKRHSNIEFKIISRDEKAVTIQAVQGRSTAENYQTQKDLISKTKDLFTKFLPGWKLNVHAVPYEEHHISKIDEKWLAKKMLDTGIKAKDIVTDTGLEKASISNWLKGSKPMSHITKVMFYYYFLNR